MAQIIPNINQCLSKMTNGEKRFARRLESHLEDDYLCWYDIPIGRDRRYPDFIVLHPGRGLLFLEVKDWKLETLKRLSKTSVDIMTPNGRVTQANPVEQARQGAYSAMRPLQADPALVQANSKHQGKLCFPYGYGVVLANITRARLTKALRGEEGAHLLPEHLVICQDEMTESTDVEAFQEKLWGMFNYSFGKKLSLPQIDRIRWHLFPEIRVGDGQGDLLNPEGKLFEDDSTLPEIIDVMDLHQEQLARNLGHGHRVIHGVAGSGKTMILGFKAVQIAENIDKPILILCFNISLAARLRHFIAERKLAHKVQVYHFHDWCGLQLKAYHCSVLPGEEPYWERQVTSVIHHVKHQQIPRAQYGAVLIDEGHDFEPEWLTLITQMVDPATDSLLLLYDDAQSIYKKKSGLKFSLKSVGIKAQGRTTILKLNYRNTKEILQFAYRFAQEFIPAIESDEDNIPLIAPESAGATGPEPIFKQFNHPLEEQKDINACIQKWLEKGVPAGDIAIITPTISFAKTLSTQLNKAGVNNHCLYDKATKLNYRPNKTQVTVLTIHSSKGLEFNRVILAGIHNLQFVTKELPAQVRLMYVGMTRAKSHLLVTASETTAFTERLVELVAP
ncbi:3'-5' exonuclease [Halioxenophilus aromaticivorans]|uniref:DNA 3'-5' helicase II n=1 Tax=Halioxenophilus aromaticivorans TaxID=1306992 RepID=A0AAV3TZK9_9ALTE